MDGNSDLSLCVFILTFNEELHIERALDSLKDLTDDIVVIDSFSTDKTIEVLKNRGVKFVQNAWPGNHADQLNWAIGEHARTAKWLMRLDADEYLTPELVLNIKRALAANTCTQGFFLQRGHQFLGKKIKFGGSFPVPILRLWRNGFGACEQRLMDEHIVLDNGSVTEVLDGYFWDANLKGLSDWIIKHDQYASKECVEQLIRKHKKLFIEGRRNKDKNKVKSGKKIYEKLPTGIRSLSYFIYRYILRLGFLDGYKGFLWHFLQGFWYRTLVDAKVLELELRMESSDETIDELLSSTYGYKFYLENEASDKD